MDSYQTASRKGRGRWQAVGGQDRCEWWCRSDRWKRGVAKVPCTGRFRCVCVESVPVYLFCDAATQVSPWIRLQFSHLSPPLRGLCIYFMKLKNNILSVAKCQDEKCCEPSKYERQAYMYNHFKNNIQWLQKFIFLA